MQSSGETRRGNENVCLSVVIASQRVRAKRGTMTGSAKQSRATRSALDCFVASLLAMTAERHESMFSRRVSPELCISITLLKNRGRREDRVAAAPGAAAQKNLRKRA